MSELDLVGSEEPLNGRSCDQMLFAQVIQQQSGEMNQRGGNELVKRPLKKTLHLLVQGFDDRQLAAFVIYHVCTLELNNPHFRNLTETVTQMRRRITTRMFMVASYVLA